MRLFTTIEPVPDGFSLVVPSKRLLLNGPVVILARNLDDVLVSLGDSAGVFTGIVVTPRERVQIVQFSSLAWQFSVPEKDLRLIPSFAACWLAAISAADTSTQQAAAADFKARRLGRELEMTRRDYNRLTLRLSDQIRELRAARDALHAMNDQLELRVKRRTSELAEANALLSQTIGELKTAQNELVRKEQLAGLGALVAGVAHELNTPIGNALTVATTLAHATDSLKNQYASGGLKRSTLDTYLNATSDITQILERNLVRSADIVGHFKQLSVDRVSESRRQFLLKDVISDTLIAMAPTLRRTPYRVAVEQTEPIEMHSHPGAISQILTNLISNALVHAFEGRTAGEIKIHVAARGGERVILSLADDGIGIPTAKRNHVFDPFFTTKLGQGGSGLGLYIVYTQVYKLLGGHLELRSEEGKGTTFFLDLPRFAPLPCKDDESEVDTLQESY